MIKLRDNRKFYSLLGLAQRAGKIKSGIFLTRQAITKKKAKLVIIAEDAADNTVRQIMDLCHRSNVPVIVSGRKDELGHFLGKSPRSVVCVVDKGFADAISGAADSR